MTLKIRCFPLCFLAAAIVRPALVPAAPTFSSTICELILKNARRDGTGIMISAAGVKSSELPPALNGNSYKFEKSPALVSILSNIPFAKHMVHDIPSLAILEWSALNDSALATFKTVSGNVISIILDPRGMIDIRIGASNDRDRDDRLFQSAIRFLRKEKAEALLFGKSNLFPPEPAEGFELWLTRLDGNNPRARAAVNEIVVHLSTN